MKKPLICISCSTSENLSAKTIRKRKGYCKKCILNAKLLEKQKKSIQVSHIDTQKCYFYNQDNEKILSNIIVEINCVSCTKKYKTNTKNELRKKHKLYCGSCAIKNEWKEEKYKNIHKEKLKEAHNKPDTLIKHSISSKKNWADKNIRDKMVGGGRYKSGIYHRINGENVFLKSSYEFMFVEFLESNGIEWRYEDTAFPILSLSNSQYIPDFYLKEYKCYFEVKGYFRDHSKIKYKFFLDQYKDINICLTFKEDLDRILTKEVSIEDFIKEKNRVFSGL